MSCLIDALPYYQFSSLSSSLPSKQLAPAGVLGSPGFMTLIQIICVCSILTSLIAGFMYASLFILSDDYLFAIDHVHTALLRLAVKLATLQVIPILSIQ